MVTSKDEDIFTDFYILLRISNLFGFSSYKIEESNKSRKYLVHLKWHYLIHNLLKVLICMGGYCGLIISFASYKNNDKLIFTLKEITQFITIISQIVFCVCNSVFIDTNRNLWQRFYEIEKDLRTSKVVFNHKHLRCVAMACVIYTMIAIFFSFIGFIFFYRGTRVHVEKIFIFGCGIFYSYRYATLGIMICQHVSLFSTLREIFLKLRVTATKKFLFGRPSTSKDLLEIAKYCEQSCDLARDVNSALSIQLLVELMDIFFLLLASTFNTAVIVVNKYYYAYEEIFLYAGWIVFGIVMIWMIIFSAHECMESVS